MIDLFTVPNFEKVKERSLIEELSLMKNLYLMEQKYHDLQISLTLPN